MDIQEFIQNFAFLMTKVNPNLGVKKEYKNNYSVEENLDLDRLSQALAKGYPYMSVVKSGNNFVASYGKKWQPLYNKALGKEIHNPNEIRSGTKEYIKDIISVLKDETKEKQKKKELLLKLLIQYDNFALKEYLRQLQQVLLPTEVASEEKDFFLEGNSITGDHSTILKKIDSKEQFNLDGLPDYVQKEINGFLDHILDSNWDSDAEWEVNCPENNSRDFQVHVEAKGLHDLVNKNKESSERKYSVGLFYSFG